MNKIKTEYYTLRYKDGSPFDSTLSIDTENHAIAVINKEADKDRLVVCLVEKTTYVLDNGRFFKEEMKTTVVY